MTARLFFWSLIILALGAVTAACAPDSPGSAKPTADAMNGKAPDQRDQATPLPLAATVLGQEVRTADAAEMQQAILTPLFERYAEQQGIEVSADEIDAYVEQTRRGMREQGLSTEDDLTPEEVAQVEKMRQEMGQAMIRQWKLNRALYRQYGGRIIFQQLGPEPLDAYRSFLEERQAAGDFSIVNPAFEDEFWDYFTNDARHSFYESGSDEEAEAFTVPFWQRAGDSAKSGSGMQDHPLADTRWRLVRFQSMDDAIGDIKPDDPSVYTMSLNADGSVQMQLNCNSASGSWQVEPAADGVSGTFRFGSLAASMALCPPPSMDERIAADAQWVRGYLLRDGQLHLSLMADAGIYSWEAIPVSD